MKCLKVYLQYPWKFPDSPYYKYLVENPPIKIKYINIEKQGGVITKKRKFALLNRLKKARHYANKMGLPFPNIHLTKKGEYDLIHCAHCLSRNKKVAWIADFESYWQFWFSGRSTKLGRNWVRKVLSEENCKKIVAWTNSVKEDILKIFPEVKNKVEVVYPAVPIQGRKKRHKGINLLFVGRYFYGKGGLHTVEVMDRITKKTENVFAYVISDTPKEILKKYKQNKKIKFLDIIPQERLFEIYSICDIYLYPGYSDTFGFSILEAMSFGIPIITVEGVVKDEIIDEGKTGFIVSSGNVDYKENIIKHNDKIVEEMVKKAFVLINDRKLSNKMSKNCIKVVKTGKFSILERNKKLRKIYEEALNEKKNIHIKG